MIIISLSEPQFSTLIKKCIRAQEKGDLIEIRLDAWKKIDFEKVKTLEAQFSPLWTLRSQNEGGLKKISSLERKKSLKELIDLKPKYLDLEFKKDTALIPYLKKESPKTKWVLSYHDLHKMPKTIEKTLFEMKKYRPWKVKIATFAKNTLESLKMLFLVKSHPHFIGICMGEAGALTRLMGPIFKQPITFAALSKKEKTAPGQWCADEMENLYHYSKLNTRTRLLGILGAPLAQSPGVKVYNQLFYKKKIQAVYVNLEVEKKQAQKALELLKALGFLGCSVTIPLKEVLFSSVDQIEKSQEGVPALNTIYFDKNKVKAKNTDGMAAVKLLKKKTRLKGKKILILGTGGTAQGIAFFLKKERAKLIFSNRTDKKAQKLAQNFQASFRPFESLKKLKREDYDVLIHTTPVGTKDSASLLPAKVIYSQKIYLDVVLNETKLLKIAQKKGSQTINGFSFWVAQAEEQLRFWFKKLKPSSSKLMQELIL